MSERLFEYRDEWIGQERGRNGYYRYWYDAQSRRTKRAKLSSTDLQSAIDELIGIISTTKMDAKVPEKVFLANVLAHYLQHYATPKGYNQMAAAKRAFKLVLASMVTRNKNPMVHDLKLTEQQLIWGDIRKDTGNTAKSIKTYFILVRAALNFAAKPQIIEGERGKTEVQLLSNTVVVETNEQKIADYLKIDISKPRDWIPTYLELGLWISKIKIEADFRFVMIMLNTSARNEAIFDLDVSKQVDFAHGLIDMNAPGRRQTKKRRPQIRLTTGLAAWLDHWGSNKPIDAYKDNVERRLNAIGKENGLPDMTIYTIRHFMATKMRNTSIAVTKEQRSKWIGHSVKEGSATTDWYETFDSDYLEAPMKATEEIIRELNKHAQQSLFAPTMHPQASLREVI